MLIGLRKAKLARLEQCHDSHVAQHSIHSIPIL